MTRKVELKRVKKSPKKVIILAGPSGAGKSSLGDALFHRGWRLVNADAIARSLYSRGKPGWKAVIAEFGHDVLGKGGHIDRRKLGGLVFSDAAAMKRLDKVLMPRLVRELRARCQKSQGRVLVDMAVYFKAGAPRLGTHVVIVDAPLRIRAARLLKRSRSGRNMVSALAQAKALSFGPKEYRRADLVIQNTGSQQAMLKRFEVWMEHERDA